MPDRFEIATAVLSAELAKPYVYGEADCFFMGCRVADAFGPSLGLTGRYWRSYTTLAGAQRALRRRGCTSIAELYARHLVTCAPAECRFGDLAIVRFDGGEHVAVCIGHRFRTKTENGPADRLVGDCIAAFRTGGRA